MTNHNWAYNEQTGRWEPAVPLGFIGWKAKLEDRFRKRGWNRLALFMANWDERGLGK
jgi:hypothetical protein